MSNCTGMIFGNVTSASGGGAGNIDVSLSWIVRADGPALQIGGDDNLQTYVAHGTTDSAGDYMIPFYWASTQVPGNVASVLARQPTSDGDIAVNQHGNPIVGLDLRKLIGMVAPPIPGSTTDGASLFLTFYLASSDLQTLSPLTRLFPSSPIISAELQGLYCRVDFQMGSTPGITDPS